MPKGPLRPENTKITGNPRLERLRTEDKILFTPYGAGLDLFHNRDDEVLMDGPAGCLGSSTRLVYNRGIRNSGRSLTIDDFYLKFNGLPVDDPWRSHIPTYLHSLGDDGVMFYNRVVAVYKSGIKPLLQLDINFHLPISSTIDHPFMTPNGFVQAQFLKPGMKVMAIGSMMAQSSGGKDLSARPPRVIVNCKYHPNGWIKVISGYTYRRVPRSWLVLEADMNGIPYDEFVYILKHDEETAQTLKYLPTGIEVHHNDGDTLNDDPSNLTVLSKSEHARHHNQKGNFQFSSTVEVEISDIRPDGEDMTYDIQMESPANNFCANGIVVHNTGKSITCLQKIHAVMSKYPGAHGFMARKTRVSMNNSCMQTFKEKVLRRADRVHLHKQEQRYNYPNGSFISIVGLDDPLKFMSTDYDLGYIQEATELTQADWEMCTTRLRNGVVPYQQQIGDCNPDKPSHWLNVRCDKKMTTRLKSRHEDNPMLYDSKKAVFTDFGKKYLGKLDRLSGARRARLRFGIWASAEGMVFEEWDKLVHMVSQKDLPPDWDSWPHYWAIDWGYTHPFCWQDWIEHPMTGQLIRVREIYQTKHLVEDHAKFIKSITSHYVPRAIICDHDAEDRATFERYTNYLCLPAYKAIQSGIQAVQARMKSDWCKHGPGVLLMRDALIKVDEELKDAGLPTCTEEEFEGYVWDEKHNRKVNSKKDELPVDKDNHGMDPLRYNVAFHDDLAIDPEDFEDTVTLGEEIIISPY